jgi:hypothetical protein
MPGTQPHNDAVAFERAIQTDSARATLPKGEIGSGLCLQRSCTSTTFEAPSRNGKSASYGEMTRKR